MDKKKAYTFILFLSIFLTGCWDNIEIEDRSHVGAIGVDRNKASKDSGSADEKFEFTFAFPKNSLEEEKDIIISSIGDSLYNQSRVLADTSNKEIFLGHLRALVISEEVIKESDAFKELLGGIENNHLLSRRVVMTMVQGSASEIINISPEIEPRIGQFISEVFKRKDRTYRIPQNDVGDILRDLYENQNTLIPRVLPWEEEVKLSGSGVIGNYEFKGWLDGIETEHLMIMTGDADYIGGMSIDYEGYKVPIDMRIKRNKMKLVDSEDHIKINISLHVEADVKQAYIEKKEDILEIDTITKMEESFNRGLREDMLGVVGKLQKEYETDVLGIDKFLRQHHYSLWKEIEADWRELFPNIEVDVNIDTKIRRVGLIK